MDAATPDTIAASEQIPAPATPDTRVDLVGLSRDELAATLDLPASERFRARQLWHWIYSRGVVDFEQMTTLSKDFRNRLAAGFVIGRPVAT
jgi:23S rRNA (adenine2503-C2)-methyltransferase